MKNSATLLLSALFVLTACGAKEAPMEAQMSSRKLTEQGYELLAQQQPRAALAMFEQAVGGNEKNIRAWQGKGLALNHMGKHEEAETAYKRALEIQPGAVAVTNNLAMSKILHGQYQEAINLLTPLSKNKVPISTVVENLALANCLLGKSDEARKLYGKNLLPAEIEENLRFCRQFEGMRKK